MTWVGLDVLVNLKYLHVTETEAENGMTHTIARTCPSTMCAAY